MKMINTIKDFVKKNKEDWCEGALEQVEKVLALLSGEDKKFTCNNGDYGIYFLDGCAYGDHEGRVYTIDTEKFGSDVQGFLDFWTVPTVEGVYVDIWLIV